MITGKKISAPQYRANRQTKGSWSPSSSRIKNLLAEEDVVESTVARKVASTQKTSSKAPLGFGNFVVKPRCYDYPRVGSVPATRYYSTIANMKVRERAKDGKVVLDVFYDLEDVYGQKFNIIQTYSADSQAFKRLVMALSAAGVPNGATVDAGIGTEEIIEVDYITPNSDMGSIVNRRPYTAPSADDEDEAENETEDSDDEFDDFLETEED